MGSQLFNHDTLCGWGPGMASIGHGHINHRKKKQQQLGVRNAVKPVVLQLTSGFGDGGYQLNQVFFLLVTPGV